MPQEHRRCDKCRFSEPAGADTVRVCRRFPHLRGRIVAFDDWCYEFEYTQAKKDKKLKMNVSETGRFCVECDNFDTPMAKKPCFSCTWETKSNFTPKSRDNT